MAVDESTKAAFGAVRDSLAGIRATCLMLTGADRDEVDQTALMLMMAQVYEHADSALKAVESLERPS